MNLVVGLSVGAVAVVLLLGLVNMLKGTNPDRSQVLMRWRVILQFIAILIMLIVIWFRAS